MFCKQISFKKVIPHRFSHKINEYKLSKNVPRIRQATKVQVVAAAGLSNLELDLTSKAVVNTTCLTFRTGGLHFWKLHLNGFAYNRRFSFCSLAASTINKNKAILEIVKVLQQQWTSLAFISSMRSCYDVILPPFCVFIYDKTVTLLLTLLLHQWSLDYEKQHLVTRLNSGNFPTLKT